MYQYPENININQEEQTPPPKFTKRFHSEKKEETFAKGVIAWELSENMSTIADESKEWMNSAPNAEFKDKKASDQNSSHNDYVTASGTRKSLDMNLYKEIKTDTVETKNTTTPNHSRQGSYDSQVMNVGSPVKFGPLTKEMQRISIYDWNFNQIQMLLDFMGCSEARIKLRWVTSKLYMQLNPFSLKILDSKYERDAILKSLDILQEKKTWTTDGTDPRTWTLRECREWMCRFGLDRSLVEEVCEKYCIYGIILMNMKPTKLAARLKLRGIQVIKAHAIIECMNDPTYWQKNITGGFMKIFPEDVVHYLTNIGMSENVCRFFEQNVIPGRLLPKLILKDLPFAQVIINSLKYAFEALYKGIDYLSVSEIASNYDKLFLDEAHRHIITSGCIHGAYFLGMPVDEFSRTFVFSDPLHTASMHELRLTLLQNPLLLIQREDTIGALKWGQSHTKSQCFECGEYDGILPLLKCGHNPVCTDCMGNIHECPQCGKEIIRESQ